jgi:SNF2 family DNA or RNA helicase
MANWANELDRFAPAIRYQILHSSAVDLNRISPMIFQPA